MPFHPTGALEASENIYPEILWFKNFILINAYLLHYQENQITTTRMREVCNQLRLLDFAEKTIQWSISMK